MTLSKEDWKVIDFFTYDRVSVDYSTKKISKREDYKLDDLETKYLVHLIKGIGEYIQVTSDRIRQSQGSKQLIHSGIFDYLAIKVMFESEINRRLRYQQVFHVFS